MSNQSGYIIPSEFKMVQTINNDEPQMLLIHKTEFNRISKKVDSGKTLSKPYKDYLEMLYKTYILNNKKIPMVHKIQMNSHMGIQKLQALT